MQKPPEQPALLKRWLPLLYLYFIVVEIMYGARFLKHWMASYEAFGLSCFVGGLMLYPLLSNKERLPFWQHTLWVVITTGSVTGLLQAAYIFVPALRF